MQKHKKGNCDRFLKGNFTFKSLIINKSDLGKFIVEKVINC